MGICLFLLIMAPLLYTSTAEDVKNMAVPCDYKYYWETDKWYKVHKEKLSRERALITCWTEGGVLGSILEGGRIDHILLDLMDEAGYLDYIHIDTPGTNEGIVPPKPYKLLLFSPRVNDMVNADLRVAPYVCTMKSNVTLTNQACATTDMDYKYNMRTKSCYKFHAENKSWCEGMNTCVSEGSRLAIINSDEEHDILHSMYSNTAAEVKGLAYMGFLSTNRGKTWKTTDGGLLVNSGASYLWAPGEPNNLSGKEFCGAFSRDSGKFHSEPCNIKRPFFCEKSATVTCPVLNEKENSVFSKRCNRRRNNLPAQTTTSERSNFEDLYDLIDPSLYDYAYDD